MLQIKDSKIQKTYTSSFCLFSEYGKAVLGIGRGALMNALSKNNGTFENKKCRIYYRPVIQKKWAEWR